MSTFNESQHPRGHASNPGAFTEKAYAEASVFLDATTESRVASLQTAAADAQRVSDQARSAANRAMADIARLYLKSEYPTAVTAKVFRSWDDDESDPHIRGVYDAEGHPIVPEDSEELSNSKALDYLQDIGRGLAWQFEEGGDEGGELFIVDLDKEVSLLDADVYGFGNLSRGAQSKLARSVNDKLGLVGGFADKNEIEYRLYEGPEFYDINPEAISRLDERFPDREDALQAIVDTIAWYQLDDDITESVSSLVTGALANAVDEILG